MYTFQNESMGKIKKLKLLKFLEENIGDIFVCVSAFVLQKILLKK